MRKQSKKTKSEMENELRDKMVALRDIRFNVAGSKSKNVKEYSVIKKDIARLKTFINSDKAKK